jgi:uncharacterized protein YeaO (DUF488 family)
VSEQRERGPLPRRGAPLALPSTIAVALLGPAAGMPKPGGEAAFEEDRAMAGKKKHEIRMSRAYEPPGPDDGCRVLVDRIWPRGIHKEELRLDAWLKDMAPSTALRKWFNHEPDKWDRFKERYFAELDGRPEAVGRLVEMRSAGTLTLVFGSRETRYNNAVAIKDYLERHE